MNNKKSAVVNTISSLIFQGMSIISGLILPRLILSAFGSEVNGLISSLQQFLNYIGLLDGGVNVVIMAALYKPLQQKDTVKISGIVKASEDFFRKIGYIYIIYALMLSAVYPLVVKSNFSWSYVASLSLILGITLLIQYMFAISYRTLLIADRKGYIVYFSQSAFFVVNLLISVLVIKFFPEIHVLKLLSACAFLIQPILYGAYVKRHYKLDKSVEADEKSLSQKWDGFGQNFALFIHNNTDVVVLTFFSTLTDVSVYTVYLMVVNSLKTIVTTVSQAILPSIGNIYAGGSEEDLQHSFDYYEFITYFLTTFLYACGIVLLVPFVQLYTIDVSDANYNQPVFGILLSLAYILECYREPFLQMTYVANKFRETSRCAYLEAVFNIVISVILVWKWGLIGVAIGTAISVLYRLIWLVLYNQKKIIKRPFKKWLIDISVSFGFLCVFYLLAKRIVQFGTISVRSWLLNAIIVVLAAAVGLLITAFIFYRPMVKKIIKMVKRNS